MKEGNLFPRDPMKEFHVTWIGELDRRMLELNLQLAGIGKRAAEK
jgi:hypothetical protein